MKIDKTEIAPSGKERLKIYVGEMELKILSGLVKAACAAKVEIEEMRPINDHLQAMNRSFTRFYKTGDSREPIKPPKVKKVREIWDPTPTNLEKWHASEESIQYQGCYILFDEKNNKLIGAVENFGELVNGFDIAALPDGYIISSVSQPWI